MTDQRDRGTQAVIAWILTVLTLLYFLPWAIAATRGKSNSGMIGLLNFLLGWTFVGWVVALVMACMSHQIIIAPPVMVIHNATYSVPLPGFAPPSAASMPHPRLGPPPEWQQTERQQPERPTHLLPLPKPDISGGDSSPPALETGHPQ